MLNSFWKYNIYWLLWLCLISYLSNAQSDGIPNISLLAFKGADKLVHGIFYFNLMLTMSWGLGKQRVMPLLASKHFLISFFFCFSWGVLMELSQLWVFTHRSAEWADVLANFTGALLGLACSRIWWNLKKIS